FQAEDGIRDRNVTGVQTCALPICGHDYLVLDRGQTAETGLATATVVGPFDPGDDRDPEFLSGGPRASVQNVLLQQGEERFHGGRSEERREGKESGERSEGCSEDDR